MIDIVVISTIIVAVNKRVKQSSAAATARGVHTFYYYFIQIA